MLIFFGVHGEKHNNREKDPSGSKVVAMNKLKTALARRIQSNPRHIAILENCHRLPIRGFKSKLHASATCFRIWRQVMSSIFCNVQN